MLVPTTAKLVGWESRSQTDVHLYLIEEQVIFLAERELVT